MTWRGLGRIICDVLCTDHRVFCYSTCLVMVAVDVPFLMIFRILITDEDISWQPPFFPTLFHICSSTSPWCAIFYDNRIFDLVLPGRLRTLTDFRPKGIILRSEPSDRCIVAFWGELSVLIVWLRPLACLCTATGFYFIWLALRFLSVVFLFLPSFRRMDHIVY